MKLNVFDVQTLLFVLMATAVGWSSNETPALLLTIPLLAGAAVCIRRCP